jgi:hypothetical protein
MDVIFAMGCKSPFRSSALARQAKANLHPPAFTHTNLRHHSGKDTLLIDFTTGVGKPDELLREPISDVPRHYSEWFWKLVESSGSHRSLVQSANLTLKYDLERTKLGSNGATLNPYDCDVSIVDIRGKTYSAHFHDWWYVDRVPVRFPRLWWKPTTWFKKKNPE